jgi:hypothetical protein
MVLRRREHVADPGRANYGSQKWFQETGIIL